MPDDLKREVQQRLQIMTSGQVSCSAGHYSASRDSFSACLQSDSVVSVHRSFCYQVSHSEYEQQKVSTSQECIAALLDRIVADKSMPAKVKKQRLKTVSREEPNFCVYSSPHLMRVTCMFLSAVPERVSRDLRSKVPATW